MEHCVGLRAPVPGTVRWLGLMVLTVPREPVATEAAARDYSEEESATGTSPGEFREQSSCVASFRSTPLA